MNNLTDYQKALDRAIDHCGIALEEFENTDRCLHKVMSAIGAHREDKEFIRERIALRVHTQAVLSKTDSFIDRTNAMLDRFEEDDKEWERRGKALGFNFDKNR